MISWNHFILFAIASVLCWATGAWGAWKEKRKLAFAATGVGLAIFFTYIVLMWISLERPPLRTMGETRLWYSFFLPLAGIIVYSRWRYKWILSFSTILSTVFVCINIFKPEIHSKTLMPALQSPWFAPHVIVYMMAYALLGAAVLMSLYLLFFKKSEVTEKEAWGHYWSWDPKETWAAITWLAYLIYIHYRWYKPHNLRPALWTLIISFCLLQMCWWGINYLPSAQGSSVHTYNLQ